jgi:2-dehydro-3-deoxyphosphogluconate aldolase/(4S)-4-hydroxy-2-oxoglutarate aldolase
MKALEQKLTQPILPVVVIEDAEKAVPLARAMQAGGLGVIEITFRTAAAADAIRAIKSEVPEMVVGAGTVVRPTQVQAAIDCGVDFGLAPGLNPETVQTFQKHGIPFIPGVMTPSDIEAALQMDCSYLKFFPAGAAGGVAMLKAMAAPYKSHGVKFCPTGGLNLDNMNDYLSMPEVFAIGGSWLATAKQIEAGDWDTITQQVSDALKVAGS